MKNKRITDKIRFANQFLLDILDYIASKFDPEDIYEFEDLANWAEENGYVKENE
jgi:hypothetical protein